MLIMFTNKVNFLMERLLEKEQFIIKMESNMKVILLLKYDKILISLFFYIRLD